MKIVYIKKYKHENTLIYSSLVEGFKKHNQELIYYDGSFNLKDILQVHKDVDLLIGQSLYKYTIPLWKPTIRTEWLKSNANFISIELGMGDFRKESFRGNAGFRRKSVTMGYNGMMGEAHFINSKFNDKRCLKHSSELSLKPWRSEKEGEYVLIIQQAAGDSSLKSKRLPQINMNKWTEEQVQKYENLGYKTRVRPRTRLVRSNPTLLPSLSGYTIYNQSLNRDFARAKFVVTCSSTCGVLAVKAGIPTVATYPVSMVYDICKSTKTPDRSQWIKDLSYCQWTFEDISNGEAWSHLRQANFQYLLNNRNE